MSSKQIQNLLFLNGKKDYHLVWYCHLVGWNKHQTSTNEAI